MKKSQNYNLKLKTVVKKEKDIILVEKLREDQHFNLTGNRKKTFLIFLIDGKDNDGDLKIHLKGINAEVEILGIILAYQRQKIRLFSLQDHEKPGSKSHLLIKSVLFDEAKFDYHGLIKIEKKAQKSAAYLRNQNLILSDKAKIVTCPYLEIFTNDVACSHGVTISEINKKELYYLTTRGIAANEANKLIVMGFLNEVLDHLEDSKLTRSAAPSPALQGGVKKRRSGWLRLSSSALSSLPKGSAECPIPSGLRPSGRRVEGFTNELRNKIDTRISKLLNGYN